MNASAKHPAAVPGDIEVRHCESLAEYEECVKLELLTWGEHIAVPVGDFCGGAPHGRADTWRVRPREDHWFYAGSGRNARREAVPAFAHDCGAAGIPEPRSGAASKAISTRGRFEERRAAGGMDVRSAGVEKRAVQSDAAGRNRAAIHSEFLWRDCEPASRRTSYRPACR